ncbi:phospholipid scramblase 1-like isoform X2 [Rana temporaria]|uniref:phospholipid scramblase 1-like isoform X2 n=1 Tax=Rana temporaria TaxID=8407 RepID=UPI001AACBC80|nr:phospholipid scramblase 1-like isoform X2 [Rana temporaria]
MYTALGNYCDTYGHHLQCTASHKITASQGWGRSFEVLDQMGQRMYEATQTVKCCGPIYNLKVQDNAGQDVMELLEHCACRCSHLMEVIVPSYGLVGLITLHLKAFVTHMSIMNPSNEVVLMILGPSFQTSIFGNVTFEVKSRDEQYVVGMIKGEGNQYTLTFPMDMEVTMKAVILASCFYLDSMIYAKRRHVANPPSNN